MSRRFTPQRCRAWVVKKQWARQIGLEVGISTVHSIYSAPGVAESAEETELSPRSKRAPAIWLGCINIDPAIMRYMPRATRGLMSTARHLALNGEGCRSKVSTRHLPTNSPQQTASHFDIISMKLQLAVQLEGECVLVGSKREVFQPNTDHRPVVLNITTDAKWAPRPKTKQVARDLRRVGGDPKLEA